MSSPKHKQNQQTQLLLIIVFIGCYLGQGLLIQGDLLTLEAANEWANLVSFSNQYPTNEWRGHLRFQAATATRHCAAYNSRSSATCGVQPSHASNHTKEGEGDQIALKYH